MEKTSQSKKRPYATFLKTNKLAAVVEIAAVFGIAALIIAIGFPMAGDNLLMGQLVVVSANAVMLFLVWCGLYLRGENARTLGLSLRFKGRKALVLGFARSLLALVLGLAGFVLGAIIMANITGMPQQADVSSYDYLKGNLPLLLLSLASIYFFSSFGEEVVYRGFLIKRLEQLFGSGRKALVLAVLVSSVIFGLAHIGWGATGMVQTAFMGLALASCFIWFKRNLWIVIAAHAYMDTALILPLYFG